MSDWLLKKLLGQDLMDKAWDLVVAEENANMIVNALKPELDEIEEAERQSAAKPQEPVLIKVEGIGGGTGIRFLQSKRHEEVNQYISGSRKFVDVEGIGTITDIYVVHASSTSFNVELIIDGESWYSDNYTNLQTTSVVDTYLSAYQDASTSAYVVKFSGISFARGFQVIVSAYDLTFDILRANYDLQVTYQ